MAGRPYSAILAAMALSLAFTACAPRVAVDPPDADDLSGEVVARTGDAPPPGPEGACWAQDRQPGVYETVTEQTLVAAETRDAEGNVLRPASYRSVSKLSQIREARDVWFRIPCPEDMSLTFIATLQRALKARGFYLAEVTGELDAATTEAVRRYQAEHGLDSAQLSLAAAKDLGLATTALDEL